MLAGGYSWRLFFYVEAAFAGALLIMAFFFVEESTYHRPQQSPLQNPSTDSLQAKEIAGEKSQPPVQLENVSSTSVPRRKSFLETLKPWGEIDHEPEFFMTILRSFTYFFVPVVFWVIATYGLYIGLGALAFNYTFPIKITAPPYNWSEVSVMFHQIHDLLNSTNHTRQTLASLQSQALSATSLLSL